MKRLLAGAPHRAIDAARLASANDLVRRTLSQHGLMQDVGGSVMSGLPDSMLRHAGAAPAAATLVPGASFTDERFTCDAGSRDYLIYVPASATAGASGVVMMLHGCTQTHRDFAAGTGMNALAETHGFIVVYPQQSRGDNAQSCWNWFSPGDQRRGRGEPAILAGMAAHVAAQHSVLAGRTFVAGLSAGAAMAVILSQTYGDVFAAVGVHSGLPFGAAKDVPSAFAAMAGNAPEMRAHPAPDRVPRTIIFHGDADHTVHLSNGRRVAHDVVSAGPRQTLARTEEGQRNGRRFTRDITETADGVALLESWTIGGLGHAWSGGQAGGSYADPAGPDASAEMVRFFLQKPEKGA